MPAPSLERVFAHRIRAPASGHSDRPEEPHVLLKQRHDELPKLVETCKQYMKFEQGTPQKMIDARSHVFSARESQDMLALGSAEAGLHANVGNLFAVAEQYPDLKTKRTFMQLQARLYDRPRHRQRTRQ